MLLTDDPGALLQNENPPPLLLVDHHTAYVSTSTHASSHGPSSHILMAENLSAAVFDTLGLTSRPGNIPAPSPRIEITPSGDSLSSQTLEPSPGSKALGAYRECVSPASSNSSTGWPAEIYSPGASPCVSPSNGASCNMGLSTSDLCLGLQGIQTSSTHSSPGTSPRNSITDETFLVPQPQRGNVPLPHQRSRSASPHGKRAYDQAHSCQGATPIKQRSRSPSPIPSPHEQQGSYYLHQYQGQDEFHVQAQISSGGPQEDWNVSSNLPRAVVRSAHEQAQRQDCAYREAYDWASEQKRIGRVGAELKSEAYYRLPTVWPVPHPVLHGAYRCVCLIYL